MPPQVDLTDQVEAVLRLDWKWTWNCRSSLGDGFLDMLIGVVKSSLGTAREASNPPKSNSLTCPSVTRVVKFSEQEVTGYGEERVVGEIVSRDDWWLLAQV